MKRVLACVAVLLLAGCPEAGSSKQQPGKTPKDGRDIAVVTTLVSLGPGAVTKETGLRYEDKVVGTGKAAAQGSRCFVHYTGWLTDGTVFDTSKKRGKPFDFSLGWGVITGWSQGVAGMKVGGVRRLVIPPELGYGKEGNGNVPPNATLVFDIELLDVQ